jgi:hypothetical protein
MPESITPAHALPVGAKVLFREGRVECVGEVVEAQPNGLVRVGVERVAPGEWITKLVPLSELQVL